MNQLLYFDLKNGKRYPYAISINVVSAIQSKYGSFEEAMSLLDKDKQKEVNLSVLIDFYYEAINEGIDIFNENKSETEKMHFISVKQAGRIISELGFNSARKEAQKAIINAGSDSVDTLIIDDLNNGIDSKN